MQTYKFFNYIRRHEARLSRRMNWILATVALLLFCLYAFSCLFRWSMAPRRDSHSLLSFFFRGVSTYLLLPILAAYALISAVLVWICFADSTPLSSLFTPFFSPKPSSVGQLHKTLDDKTMAATNNSTPLFDLMQHPEISAPLPIVSRSMLEELHDFSLQTTNRAHPEVELRPTARVSRDPLEAIAIRGSYQKANVSPESVLCDQNLTLLSPSKSAALLGLADMTASLKRLQTWLCSDVFGPLVSKMAQIDGALKASPFFYLSCDNADTGYGGGGGFGAKGIDAMVAEDPTNPVFASRRMVEIYLSSAGTASHRKEVVERVHKISEQLRFGQFDGSREVSVSGRDMADGMIVVRIFLRFMDVLICMVSGNYGNEFFSRLFPVFYERRGEADAGLLVMRSPRTGCSFFVGNEVFSADDEVDRYLAALLFLVAHVRREWERQRHPLFLSPLLANFFQILA